jgi:hypothetical protein
VNHELLFALLPGGAVWSTKTPSRGGTTNVHSQCLGNSLLYWLMDEVFAPNYKNYVEADAEMIIQFGAHCVEMIIDCVTDQPD